MYHLQLSCDDYHYPLHVAGAPIFLINLTLCWKFFVPLILSDNYIESEQVPRIFLSTSIPQLARTKNSLSEKNGKTRLVDLFGRKSWQRWRDVRESNSQHFRTVRPGSPEVLAEPRRQHSDSKIERLPFNLSASSFKLFQLENLALWPKPWSFGLDLRGRILCCILLFCWCFSLKRSTAWTHQRTLTAGSWLHKCQRSFPSISTRWKSHNFQQTCFHFSKLPSFIRRKSVMILKAFFVRRFQNARVRQKSCLSDERTQGTIKVCFATDAHFHQQFWIKILGRGNSWEQTAQRYCLQLHNKLCLFCTAPLLWWVSRRESGGYSFSLSYGVWLYNSLLLLHTPCQQCTEQ